MREWFKYVEIAQEWGNSLWQNTQEIWQTSPLKKNIIEFGTAVKTNATVYDLAASTLKYSYNTVSFTFQQLSVTPKILYSLLFHPKTKKVAYHAAVIAWEDLMPLVLINYTHDLVRRPVQNYLDGRDSNLLSVDTLISMSLTSLNMAIYVLNSQRNIRSIVRIAALLSESPGNLNSVKTTPPMELCRVQEKCPNLQGTLRETAALFATDFAIKLVNYLPVVGPGAATFLKIYHRGRYVTTISLSDLCNRHHQHYLREYSEFALSMGISHYYMASKVLEMIEHYTTVPSTYYEEAIMQLFLLIQISIAAHMNLPTPIKESTRTIFDPVDMYQKGFNFLFDSLSIGLKKTVPPMFKVEGPTLPWDQYYDNAMWLWENPKGKRAKELLLPKMLHTTRDFITDPVIAPNWNGLRIKAINFIDWLEEIKKKYITQLATYDPKKAAKAIWLAYDISIVLSELLLSLLGNAAFMAKVSELRRNLEGLNPAPGPEIDTNNSSSNALPLRSSPVDNQHDNSPKVEELTDLGPDSNAVANEALEHNKAITEIPTPDRVESIIKPSSKPVIPQTIEQGKTLIDPLTVVRNNNSFFNNKINPHSVIHRRSIIKGKEKDVFPDQLVTTSGTTNAMV